MRVAVYQRHLATLGGGERYTLDWARWLADRGHRVELLAPPPTTLEAASARLGHDVRGIALVRVDPARPCEDAAERSAAYDLFVNLSHGSHAASLARAGVYVSHFPEWGVGPGDVLTAAHVASPGGAAPRGAAWAFLGEGFRASPRGGHWTGARATIVVGRWGRGGWDARLTLARREGTLRGSDEVEVRLDGQPVAAVRLPRAGARRVTVPLPPARAQVAHLIDVCGDPRVDPATGLPAVAHLRELELRARGSSVVRPGAPGRNLPHLATYDRVVANSRYTAGWVRRRWQRECEVVHPVVRPIEAATERARTIVCVGRFFAGGHSKRQLEMVRCFKRMCDEGLEGWRLELIGGSDPLSAGYAERVRREADGYPVELLLDAPRELLEERVGRASLVWQAAGWGEDPDLHPERFEHFGVGLVEAMGGGAVPVAYGVGGPAEIVRDGRDGILWTDSPDRPTAQLLRDPARLRRMSASARERAGSFDRARFDAAAERALAGLL